MNSGCQSFGSSIGTVVTASFNAPDCLAPSYGSLWLIVTANPKQSKAAKGQGQMTGREEVNVQRTGSGKSFDLQEVTCCDVGCGASPMAWGSGFTCASVPACMHLMVSITKIALLEGTILQSPLTKQDDTVILEMPLKPGPKHLVKEIGRIQNSHWAGWKPQAC